MNEFLNTTNLVDGEFEDPDMWGDIDSEPADDTTVDNVEAIVNPNFDYQFDDVEQF